MRVSRLRSALPSRPKPLLASEELRADLAPLEPARTSCRTWIFASGLLLLAVGLAYRFFGLGVPTITLSASSMSFSAAAAALALALLPFPYTLRAIVSLLIGLTVSALGLINGTGPLGGLAVDGGIARDALRLLVLTAVPATLLFRSQYRAYPPARWLVGAALLLTVPFLFTEVGVIVDSSTPISARLGAVVITVVLCTVLAGIMNEPAAGAALPVALAVVTVLPLELALRELSPIGGDEVGTLTHLVTAVGTLASGGLMSLGVYQLLAAYLGPRARVLARTTETPPEPEPELEGVDTLS
jgi:hypothetical protein